MRRPQVYIERYEQSLSKKNETVTVLYSHVKTKNSLNTNGKIGH